MSDPVIHTTAIARRADKTARPGHWVMAVELPGGLVAWAHYVEATVWGHGIETGKTVDQVVAQTLRRIPVPTDH